MSLAPAVSGTHLPEWNPRGCQVLPMQPNCTRTQQHSCSAHRPPVPGQPKSCIIGARSVHSPSKCPQDICSHGSARGQNSICLTGAKRTLRASSQPAPPTPMQLHRWGTHCILQCVWGGGQAQKPLHGEETFVPLPWGSLGFLTECPRICASCVCV